MTDTKVAIVGMMASGKTTIGRALAGRLGIAYVDSDHEMIRRAGMGVADYFARYGEDAFRRMERETVAGLIQRPGDLIMSLGGGAYMQAEIRDYLKRGAKTIFLQVHPDEIIRRLEGTDIARRPLLAASEDWRSRVTEILAEREAVYAEADMIFDAGRAEPEELADDLARLLRGISELSFNVQGGSHG